MQTEVPCKNNWKQEGPLVGWELDQFYKWVRIISNFSCPQSPSLNSKETRSHMQPHPGAGSQPRGSELPWTVSQWRPEHRHSAAAGSRIVCQPSLINSTSVQVLELSRSLNWPGRPGKLLNLKKTAWLSQAPPESKCASFSLLLSNCSEQGAQLYTIFFYLPSSLNGKVCGVPVLNPWKQVQGSFGAFAKGVIEVRLWEKKMAQSCNQSQSHKAYGEHFTARSIPPGSICYSKNLMQNGAYN